MVREEREGEPMEGGRERERLLLPIVWGSYHTFMVSAGHQKKVSKETQAVLRSQITAMEVANNEQYVEYYDLVVLCLTTKLITTIFRTKEHQATLKVLEAKEVKGI